MMRKTCCVALGAVVVFLLLFACTMGGDEYYVSFNAAGSPVTLTWGDVPWLADEYPYAYGGIDGLKTVLHVEASQEGDNNHYMRFYFPGSTTGTYSGAPGDIDVEYAIDDSANLRYDSQSFTVTVLELGEVGGVIAGTFSGTLFDSDLGQLTITDGRFRVKRVE